MMEKPTSSPQTCMDDYDPNSMLVEQALQRISDAINTINAQQTVPINESLDRVLAEIVKSNIDVPPYTNSAMDGYAINGDDLPVDGKKKFQLAGTVMAGSPLDKIIQRGECARIMTGGKMPQGTDTVIMQEHVTTNGNTITIGSQHRRGQNVRHSGEDIAVNQAVLEPGKRITAADIGLMASLGIAKVAVKKPLTVAFFSTGDELVAIGSALQEGQIYDSNRYTVAAMLKRFGATILDLGVIKDNKKSIEDAFKQAASQADVLITTGGVSVGDADYVKETLEKLGNVNFWKIAMKPGRPLAFGSINNCLFFGLPGNPVSTMVTFYQFVLPALKKLQGDNSQPPVTLSLRCTTPLRKSPGRIEFQRGIMEHDKNGDLIVRSVGGQGSHILSSMSKANCFIILPMECGNLEANSNVTVQPFAGLI